MLKKILIANRGEIALRVIRACHELEIKTVAVYSKADELSLHVRFADEAVCIGENESRQSYLNIPSIISAAEITNSDSIHPGYGFLSENPDFARICVDNGFVFIGPQPEVISAMGIKATAKETMKKAGLPVIPGSDGVVQSVDHAKELAKEMGFPVMLKASAGGGGRGMRLVTEESEIEHAYQTASAEAYKAFNNDSLYLEKYFETARHIEVQIAGDKFGNVVHLGERECSIQRRHQKLIEESPSSVVDDKTREILGELAVRGAKYINYEGLGTIEFLRDEHGKFYFMEMNTRIQVEHPITEMVIGKDLVKLQIKIASGENMPDQIQHIKLQGHAIECRINAEDPRNKFMPSPGLIKSYHMPGGIGVRVDTHAYAGYTIPQYYDSMIAKIIVHADDRATAINRMLRALEETIIEGPKTTIPFHQVILKNDDFRSGNISTRFLETIQFV